MNFEYIELSENVKVPSLCKLNADTIEEILKIDSSYRNVFFGLRKDTAKELITNNISSENDIIEFEILKKICEAVNNENSTHLASEGSSVEKGKHHGIENMASGILKIDNWLKRIKSGDPTIVDEISQIIPTKKNFSFASKLCHYIGFYSFGNENLYSIYDYVIAMMTPFYYKYYCDKKTTRTNMKNYKSTRSERYCYKNYQELIDEIISIAGITRHQYDRIVWYYFKGDKELIDQIYKI